MELQEGTAQREVIDEVAGSWDIDPDSLTLIRDGMNHVYEAVRYDDRPVIIRVTDDAHRNEAMVLGEVQWITYLAEAGCRVAHALLNDQQRYVESRTVDDRLYHVVCFERCSGETVSPGKPNWDQPLFRAWGRAIGHIHRVSTGFRSRPPGRRGEWYDEPEFLSLAQPDPVIPEDVLEIIRVHVQRMRSLPHGRSYGLVHNDVKDDNFFLVEGDLQLFDFDEAVYCWLANDLVVPLYFYFCSPRCRIPDATNADAAMFLSEMVAGYREEHELTAESLSMIPDLLRLREMLIYLIIAPRQRYWDAALEGRPVNMTAAEAVRAMEKRMRGKKPILNLDFAAY